MTTAATNHPRRHARLSNILFYYGHRVCPERLRRFDLVVLDPDSDFAPAPAHPQAPRALAYTSVCEALPGRSWFHRLPARWLAGRHAAWQSHIVDQAAPGWPEFFVEHVAAPCWRAGYRGFFLDTMDSYQRLCPQRWPRAQQQQGIVRLVRLLRTTFPAATLITNRGFELMDALHPALDAVSFESLYLGWDQQGRQYVDVSAGDRQWLLAQAARVRALGLPVIAIDFCPPGQARRARDARNRIRQHGLIPCLADKYFQVLPDADDGQSPAA